MTDKEWRRFMKDAKKRNKARSTKMYITITEDDVNRAKNEGVGWPSYSFAVKRLVPEGMYITACSEGLERAGNHAVGRYMIYIDVAPTHEEIKASLRNRGGQ